MLLCRAGSGAPETRTAGEPSRRVAVRAQDRAPARAVRAVVELQPSRARAHTAVDARTFFLERWKAKKKTRRSWREDGAFGRRSPTRPQAVDDGNGNKGKKLLKKYEKRRACSRGAVGRSSPGVTPAPWRRSRCATSGWLGDGSKGSVRKRQDRRGKERNAGLGLKELYICFGTGQCLCVSCARAGNKISYHEHMSETRRR